MKGSELVARCAMRGVFTVDKIASFFKRAKKEDIVELLDGFAALGLVVIISDERGKRWSIPRKHSRA